MKTCKSQKAESLPHVNQVANNDTMFLQPAAPQHSGDLRGQGALQDACRSEMQLGLKPFTLQTRNGFSLKPMCRLQRNSLVSPTQRVSGTSTRWMIWCRTSQSSASWPRRSRTPSRNPSGSERSLTTWVTLYFFLLSFGLCWFRHARLSLTLNKMLSVFSISFFNSTFGPTTNPTFLWLLSNTHATVSSEHRRASILFVKFLMKWLQVLNSHWGI